MSDDDDDKPAPTAPRAPTAALSELRATVDRIDQDLVTLVAQRMDTVRRIIAEKKDRTAAIRDARRESEVLNRVETLARAAGVSAPLARKIFSELIAHSVSRQASTLTGLAGADQVLQIAHVGSPYTFNHLAALKFAAELNLTAEHTGRPSIKEAVALLEQGEVDLLLLNIESTAAGSINQVYDVLREKDLHIVGEETIKVDLVLCGVGEVPMGSIEKVLSHPLALEQCSLFLEALPRARAVPVVDTAEAMRLVRKAGDPTQLAIGSPEGADAHDLQVLRRGIANHEEILHRYVALARTPTRFDARIPCRTSLILSTRHEHGALLACLAVLGEHGLSLTKLESRPHPDRPWEYMFFVDFEGNISEPGVAAALDELRSRALFLKVLGCYPAKANAVEAHVPGVESPRPAAPDLHLPGAVTATVTATVTASVAAAEPAAAVATAPARPRTTRPPRLWDRHSRSEDTLVRVGNLLIGGGGFVVMAGPGAVESEQQIAATARFVRDHGAHILRGGIFRPRGGPDGGDGIGLEGLELLAAAGKAVGMPVVTEVLGSEDVRPVAERADILQVGARNMQNGPLLRELGKVNRPVLLKRGLSATIDDWLAAAEQILSQGNGQVILCERGIRTFERATPSTLDLSAVVVLKERTHLPVVVDPSQATGRASYVAPMSWAARACGAHGLLVEVHPDPANAHVDGDQSLDFPGFARLMEGLGARPA
jgi:chorismate mutase / prephenate dehydratase